MGIRYRGVKIHAARNTHEAAYGLIDKPRDSIVVDVPCGAGSFLLRLMDGGFRNVLGIDINNMLELDSGRLVLGNMDEALPLMNESADLLLCIDGIEHIRRQFDFVAEAHRVLKKDGELIITTPNISSLKSRWRWLLSGHHHLCSAPLDEKMPSPWHHVGMLSYPELRYMLHASGFVITKVATSRMKPMSWVYMLGLPVAYLATSWVYWREGRKQGTRAINREIKKAMFSLPVLLGEILVVRAAKVQAGRP
jgi:2-polyprenyl-3-methyl-5-hydroxy-6-metoxy-1,4-benzoquinol methylase